MKNKRKQAVSSTVGRRVLPSWDLADARVHNGTANPLEWFLYSNEPAGLPEELRFREELTAALEWYAQNK